MARGAQFESISGRQDFQRLSASPFRMGHGVLSMSFLPDASQTRRALAFSVHKSVGNAVTRNLIRRRLRAILSAELSHGDNVGPGFYLVRARSSAATASFGDLRRDVAHMLSRLKTLLPEPPRSEISL